MGSLVMFAAAALIELTAAGAPQESQMQGARRLTACIRAYKDSGRHH